MENPVSWSRQLDIDALSERLKYPYRTFGSMASNGKIPKKFCGKALRYKKS